MRSRVGIVLLNWNGWRDTIECLESISHLDYPEFSVFVVDNASTDQSLERLREWSVQQTNISESKTGRSFSTLGSESTVSQSSLRGLEFIASPVNGGFAAGNNIGIRAALASGCDFVWLLNNDTVVEPKALSGLVARAKNDPAVGMCGSVLCYYDERETVQAFGGVNFSFFRALGRQIGQGLAANAMQLQKVQEDEITYVSGASMLLSRSFLLDVGLMEESYFLYFEEIDWAARAGRRWKTAVARDSVVFHKEGGSIGTASRTRRSPLSQYYLSRNLIYFYARHKPALLPIAVARLVREFLNQLRLGDSELARITLQAFAHACIGRRGASFQ